MTKYEYLTGMQIDILLKCYYLRKFSRVAEMESITASKVKLIKENALRTIRLAYSKSHMQGLQFNGDAVLEHMAVRCGMKSAELSHILDGFIAEGLASESRKYWVRIKKKGDVPTAAEMLDFLYDKYEVDIEGGIS